ncbi:MAG: sigma 54-interacting transcriptional regulator [Deferrisomatales bacterium]|nr:sigma 54-interacting transcriptional regulator [Deferrisomatales bacterium]
MTAAPQVDGPSPFFAQAPAMVRVLEVLRRISATDVRLVLYGEAGVGRSHAATVLHAASPRAGKPLVRVHLRRPGVAEQLSGKGLLASLEGGTLVLEEVDQASAEVQALLVGLVEEWDACEEEAEAVVRIVSTAQRDLLAGVEGGWFRRDLYYLLEVFPLAVPPLRERLEEVPAHWEHFARRHAPDRRLPPVPEAFMAQALGYSWPGNLRELESLVVAALPSRDGGPWELPATLPRRGSQAHPVTFAQAKREFERAYVQTLLLLTEGNVTQAAEYSGKARKDFYTLMARSRVDPAAFRGRAPP